jgi:uncharacterized membrane protein (UPF0127 family)
MLAVAVVGLVAAGCRAITPRDRIDVMLDGKPLSCFVAATPESRERGLQGHPPLQPGRGMLLVNDTPGPVAVAIKDLTFPIDVAIVDSDLHVVKAASLDPESARALATAAPALYVVEMPEGWLESNGVGVGSTLDFPGRRP